MEAAKPKFHMSTYELVEELDRCYKEHLGRFWPEMGMNTKTWKVAHENYATAAILIVKTRIQSAETADEEEEKVARNAVRAMKILMGKRPYLCFPGPMPIVTPQVVADLNKVMVQTPKMWMEVS
jgi:hypothetical protein